MLMIAAAICMGLAASCTPKYTRAVEPAQRRELDTAGKISEERIEVDAAEKIIIGRDASAEPVDLESADFARVDTLPELSIIIDPDSFQWWDEEDTKKIAEGDVLDTLWLDPDDSLDVIVIDTVPVPTVGGVAHIYLQRGFLDDVVSEMVRLNPFGGDGSERRLFNVTDSTHRRLEFTMVGEVRRANGRRVTALDFVELWSRSMKARPAQGLALFRNVQGAEDFVNEKAPLVRGFNAADERTVQIRFAKPDPLAFKRLNSPRLIGGPFQLGPYYTGSSKDAEYKLLPNANRPADAPAFLQECVVTTGGDPTPLASFASGKYAAMTLYAARDLRIARAEHENNRAELVRLPADRYFLACRVDNLEARRFVRRAVSGRDLLVNTAGAEGEEIGSVVSRAGAPADPQRSHASAPNLSKPLRLIFRSDDPISKAVAEKISADLNRAGMASEAVGHAADRYETALVRGQYDCAAGWVQETVLESETEQLHLASIWFADDMDHAARVREYREIPLFSVNNYLLLRNDVRLYQDRISGMWIDMSVTRGIDTVD